MVTSQCCQCLKTVQCSKAGKLMANDLEKVRKEASWSNVRLYPRICMEGVKNHDIPHPGYMMSWPRFKLSTFK